MPRRIDRIRLLRFFGDTMLFGGFLTLMLVFLSAYLSSDFTTIVTINEYGEAHVEMMLFLFFLFPLSLITVAFSFVDWRRNMRTEKRRYQKYLLTDAQRSKQKPSREWVICPRCCKGFYVDKPHLDRIITCPICGLVGIYEPIDKNLSFKANDKPSAKSINMHTFV